MLSIPNVVEYVCSIDRGICQKKKKKTLKEQRSLLIIWREKKKKNGQLSRKPSARTRYLFCVCKILENGKLCCVKSVFSVWVWGFSV